MGSDTNLNGASPFVHHLVDAHLEHLSVPQGSAAQYHTMIEVISGAEAEQVGTQTAAHTMTVPKLHQQCVLYTHCFKSNS